MARNVSSWSRTLSARILFGVTVADIWTGVSVAGHAATSFPLLPNVVVGPESMPRLGLRALTLDISNSDFVSRLNRGPVRILEPDVARVLDATYDDE